MAKTTIEIQAKDNASKVIGDVRQSVEGVKQSINDTVGAGSNLDKIRARFDKITSSGMGAKRELRALEQIMSRMNLDGLANTDVFTEIAQRAGTLKDAMLDARQATAAYASDEFKLQAMGEALGGIAAAGSIATGAMGLFGVENEKVAQAILKVQSAQALLNGVTQIAKLLNKDSVLMLRLKQIQLAANSATTTTLTTTTTANTTATAANTVVTNVSTKAGKAWNVVKAISKALLGDFTGLIIVGAAALATYAIATQNSADEENKAAQAAEALKQKQAALKKQQDEITESASKVKVKFFELQTQWQSLQTLADKKKWIDENKSSFNQLGLSINSVTTAEEIFTKNTDAVVEALIARAIAAKRAEQAANDLIDLDKKRSGDSVITYRKAHVGDRIDPEEAKRAGVYHLGGYSQEEIDKVNQLRAQDAKNAHKQRQKAYNEQEKDIKNNLKKSIQLEMNAQKQLSKFNDVPVKSGTTTPKSETSKNTPTYKPGSLNEMKANLRELEQSLSDGLIPKEAQAATIRQINLLKMKIESEEERLGFKKGHNFADDIKPPKTGKDKPKVEVEVEANWDKFMSKADTAMGAFSAIDGTVSSISRLTDSIAEGANAWEIFMNVISTAASIIETINAVMQVYNMITKQNTAEKIANASASVGEAAAAEGASIAESAAAAPKMEEMMANKLLEASVLDLAAAEIFLAHAPIPFAGVGIATGLIATMMAAQAAQHAASLSLQAFAGGGIIQGSRTIGDSVLVAANGGEMMLNTKQQNHLFKMIDAGRMPYSAPEGPVVFKIKGKTLEGVQRNYGNKMKKIR